MAANVSSVATSTNRGPGQSGNRSVRLRDLTWPDVERLVSSDTIVILPTAAIEQHGRHLPLEVDTRLVEGVACLAAEQVSGRTQVLVAPTVCYGVSGYHMGFPGTMTLTMSTFITVVEELCDSLIHHGFRRILILNGHGGNDDPIKIAARNVADRTGVAVATASYWNLAADDLAEFQNTEVDSVPGHACGFETAMMMALRPEIVRPEEMLPGTPDIGDQGSYFTDRLRHRPLAHLPQQAGVVSEHGWAGDPTKASEENGRKYLQRVVSRVADFLDEFAQDQPTSATFAYRPKASCVSST